MVNQIVNEMEHSPNVSSKGLKRRLSSRCSVEDLEDGCFHEQVSIH